MNELALTPQEQLAERAMPQPPMARARAWFDQPALRKSLPVLGLLAVVAAAAMTWLALREAPQRDLFRGLPETDQAAVAEALQQSQIAFAINDATGALTVGQDDYHRARMALAAQGLPKSAPSGDSILSAMPMGTSRAVEGEKLRTAREMDLARTIEAIGAVETARVHLAVEPPSLFIRDKAAPAASVMLNMRGGARLSDDQVQAIVHLVASSVPALASDNVSVIDQAGRLLSRQDSNGAAGEASQQLDVQERIEDRYRRALMALLTPMLGADNFTAEVTAEVDFSEKQATRESFPQDDARVRTEQGSWSNDPGERPTYGIPGALSNTAPAPATQSQNFPTPADPAQAAVTESTRTSEKFAREFELGREVSVTKDGAGRLSRISVAVALRSPVGKKQRSKQEIAAVEALVKGAIGFNATRGDVVAVEARDFQTSVAPTESWWEAPWVDPLVRNVSALLVALLLVIFLGRPLLKSLSGMKRQGAIAPGQIATEIGGELTRQAAKPVSLEMIGAASGYGERAALIQDFVRQNPDHAALVVQELLAEDTNEPANG
ncbi:MAG: flagellar basal-body MS-ring/collar protein FliF [Parasphingorhabdus sp.]|nr:flagellar basal-body MS-ring/collar protein FliF [Parasphingorhabdus sp.]